MATNNMCGDCVHFSDVGKCRIAATSKRDTTGFFSDACALFTNNPTEKDMEVETKVSPEPIMMQVCSVCGRKLFRDKFYKNRWGYTSVCIECANKKKAETSAQKEAKPKKKAPIQEYKVKPKEDPKPVKRAPLTPEEAEAAKHNAILAALTVATDQELADELKRRGYRGHLSKTIINAE